jgi:hypothetical protein
MSKTPELSAICTGWWAELTNKDIGRSRAEWAQLRRAASLMDALMIPAVHRLHKRLAEADHDLQRQPDRLALVAMSLAQVGHQAHVAALARDLLWWNDTTRSPWCFEYYGAAGAAPEQDFETNSIEETGA